MSRDEVPAEVRALCEGEAMEWGSHLREVVYASLVKVVMADRAARTPSASQEAAEPVSMVRKIIERHTRAHWTVDDGSDAITIGIEEDFPEPDGYLAMATEIVAALAARTPSTDQRAREEMTLGETAARKYLAEKADRQRDRDSKTGGA